jgi:hypothetical protein
MAVPETRGVALGREMDQLFEKQDGTESADASEEYEAAEEVMFEVNETSPLLFSDQRRRRRSSVALIV